LLEQVRLIERVSEVCRADNDLDAALMYGSFAEGAADEHSDIEFWLFFTTPPDDCRAWIEQVSPVTRMSAVVSPTGCCSPITSGSAANGCGSVTPSRTPNAICCGWPGWPRAAPSTGSPRHGRPRRSSAPPLSPLSRVPRKT
jgi:hypothetical protein